MTIVESPPARKRNAAATRTALLDAAAARFSRDGYDRASMRDIASDAGVDASLVCRYFGGKDELFSEVLACSPGPDGLFDGDRATFGARIARMLVFDPQDNRKLDCFFMMLRSASSQKAAEEITRSSAERFYGPFAQFLGGENAVIRAHLAGSLMKGVMLNRAITPDLGLSLDQREGLCAELARTLQAIIDDYA